MPEVLETFARLQYELVEFAMRLAGDPSPEDVSGQCENIWDRVQGNRTAMARMTFDDFKTLFESTLDRCKTIVQPVEE